MTPEIENDDGIERLAHRLEAERPVPSAAFRGELRRLLLGRAERQASAPVRIRRLIFAYASSGTALLAVAAIGLAGVGPFAS